MTRIATICLLLTSCVAAYAGPPPKGPGPAPCISAVQKFCAGVPVGFGRRLACLAEHKAQLTPACRERLALMQSVFEEGQKSIRKTEAYLEKHDPEEAKAFKKLTSPPPDQPVSNAAAPNNAAPAAATPR